MKPSRFKHWTPRYIFNRIKVFVYEKTNPDVPWLTKKSNQLLSKLLKNSDVMLELGSGRSTKWFSERVKKIISLEHNREWYDRVKELNPSDNSDILLIEDQEEYINYINEFDDNFFDVCLVDGIERGRCLLNAYNIVKSGGLIIFDDANAYIHNPYTYSPYSAEEPINDVYKQVAQLINDDKLVWTSNGIKDTLLIFKR